MGVKTDSAGLYYSHLIFWAQGLFAHRFSCITWNDEIYLAKYYFSIRFLLLQYEKLLFEFPQG